MKNQIKSPPNSEYSILMEPTRIVGRIPANGPVDIDADQPVERLLGGYVVYYSGGLPFSLDMGRGWQSSDQLLVVEPYRKHRLRRCPGLRTTLIEPESVNPGIMADERWVAGTASYPAWVERIDRGFTSWLRTGTLPGFSVDEMIFGENLPARELDPRIEMIISQITGRPGGPQLRVEELAESVNLSPSRLSHLFREQLGISMRSFRAWKRVRQAIGLTVSEPVLVRAAVNAGYADEAHFSRSMRKYFGQQANQMRRHWRSSMIFRGVKGTQNLPTLEPDTLP